MSRTEAASAVGMGRLVRQPRLAAVLGSGMLAAAGIGFFDPALGPYMMKRLGYDEVAVGLAFGLMGSVYAVMTPVVG